MGQTKTIFGEFDIPLTCSIFLEPALKKYRRFSAPVSDTTESFIHEWNKALVDVMRQPDMKKHLGPVGDKVLRNTLSSKAFPAKCVDAAWDIRLQSLHYSIRFSESINFLKSKLDANKDDLFVDFGCGFSPMAAAVQNEYNLDVSYCIDMPRISDVCDLVARRVGGKVPTFISWADAENLAKNHNLNTIVSMGVFPYIGLDEQIEKLKFIDKNFNNFLLEIKYSSKRNKGIKQDEDKNIFDVKALQQLQIDVRDTGTIETAVIKNSLRYLHNFIHALPNRKYFLENERSLFLSR